jgi:hypothetical protein
MKMKTNMIAAAARQRPTTRSSRAVMPRCAIASPDSRRITVPQTGVSKITRRKIKRRSDAEPPGWPSHFPLAGIGAGQPRMTTVPRHPGAPLASWANLSKTWLLGQHGDQANPRLPRISPKRSELGSPASPRTGSNSPSHPMLREPQHGSWLNLVEGFPTPSCATSG